MKEYIEREAVLQNFKEVKPVNWDNTEYEKQAITDYNFYRSIVENTLAADVAPVIHGEWLHKNGEMYCSVCGSEALMDEVYYKSPYCPDCGARMDGGK